MNFITIANKYRFVGNHDQVTLAQGQQKYWAFESEA